MNIPFEISSLIGRHLDNHTLASCVRVCKNWHEMFIPLLYKTYDSCEPEELPLFSLFEFYDVGTEDNDEEDEIEDDQQKFPSNIGLLRHGCHIKELSVTLPCSALETLAVTTGHITKLCIVCSADFDYSTLENEHGFQLLLANNVGIQQLKLRGFTGPWGSKSIEQLSQKCLQLQELSVEESGFNFSDIAALAEESLQLSQIQFNNSEILVPEELPAQTLSLPSFNSLELKNYEGLETSAALEMAARWPQLKSLSLIRFKDYTPQYESLELQYLQLSRLQLKYLRLEDVALAHLLSKCPLLSDLTLCDQPLKKDVFAALKGLAGTLTSLTLYESYDEDYTEPDTWRQKRLLCFLPKLVHFSCSSFDVDEAFSRIPRNESLPEGELDGGVVTIPHLSAQEGTPTQDRWACTNLQTFHIMSLVLSRDSGNNKAAVDQLSALHDLRYFSAKSSSRHSPAMGTIVGNMVHVSSNDIFDYEIYDCKSVRLRRHDLVQDPELQWMAKAWPKIQYYSGPSQFGTDS